MKITIGRMDFAGLILLRLSDTAKADFVFALVNVRFSDRGAAFGTFTTNDALTTVTAADIRTTNVGTITGFLFTVTAGTQLPATLFFQGPGSRQPQLSFGVALTSAGATFRTGVGASREVSADNIVRSMLSGSSVAVPEPSSLALAAVGTLSLAGTVSRARRRGVPVDR